MYRVTATYSVDGYIRWADRETEAEAIDLAYSLATLCPDWEPTVLLTPETRRLMRDTDRYSVYTVMAHKPANDTVRPVVFVTVERVLDTAEPTE